MERPLVSVHIITYNQKPYIARAIEGALQQQVRFATEIIVGDDGSTDGTREIVLRYQRKHPGLVRAITSDRNLGAHHNSRCVREACRGKYMALCDGDDYWTDPGKLQKQVDFLEAHPAYSLCCHGVEVVCAGVRKIDRFVDFTFDTFTFEDAVRGHFIPASSVVCRREPIAVMPPWFEECVCGDIPMELLLLDSGPGYYFRETMAVKLDNPGGVSQIRRGKAQVAANLLRMYKALDRHTEGRHRRVLRWKIARLSLTLAREHFKTGRFMPFCRYTGDSFRHDPKALWKALVRRMSRTAP
jgi:glycosyltransferase involved in cell wall biosynthesis